MKRNSEGGPQRKQTEEEEMSALLGQQSEELRASESLGHHRELYPLEGLLTRR